MAGGNTEAGGNGSVWWKVHHFDDNGRPRRQRPAGSQNGPVVVDEVRAGEEVEGHDDTPVRDVGRRLGHAGDFVVRLRYETMEAARRAGEWVAQNVKPGQGGFYLEVLVPAIDRDKPTDNQPMEVRVDW
jgi:hypothetical protein